LSAEKVPTEPVFQYHLGMAYMQVGDFEKAKRALTKALSLKPDFDGAAAARKALATMGA
jgi:Flp pilus assembly protein TadD